MGGTALKNHRLKFVEWKNRHKQNWEEGEGPNFNSSWGPEFLVRPLLTPSLCCRRQGIAYWGRCPWLSWGNACPCWRTQSRGSRKTGESESCWRSRTRSNFCWSIWTLSPSTGRHWDRRPNAGAWRLDTWIEILYDNTHTHTWGWGGGGHWISVRTM